MSGNTRISFDRNTQILCFSAALVLMSPQAVTAQLLPDSPEKSDALSLYRQSGIDASQEAQISEMARNYQAVVQMKQERAGHWLNNLKRSSLQPDPDAVSVLNSQEEINRLLGEIATERVKLMLRIRSVLTPEQKQKLVDLLRQRSGEPAQMSAGQ